ncbi:MAG TPA: S41 family peptidase [Candidatus Elarobacter sp.]
MRFRLLPLVLAVLIAALPYAPAPAAQARAGAGRAAPSASLGALDVIALEICYTTILARYYAPVDPGDLLRGARRGIAAYLASRGITNAAFSAIPAHLDRYRAESAIDRDVALAVARYGKRVRTADLVSKTISGELAALHDPYSVLFPPAGFKKFVGFLDGAPQAGIGAELDVDPRTHAVRVVEIFLDSPAETSALRVGDTITSIDGNPPPATTPDAVARALRGAPGTTVRIGFTHDGEPQEPIAIVRRIFAVPDVTARILADGIAYLRIRSFGARSPQALDISIERLRVVKPRAYVLDLRANGGGYRDAAVSIGGRFVRGTIVTTQERTGKPVAFTAKGDVVPLGAPLAVLVDSDTASAAEIVAGAIQDAKAGTLVGTRTFGKGLVQETFALPDGGAIKLTTARYLTPAGRDIDKVGITPDVVVAQPSDAHPGEPGRDAQLDRALALLKAAFPPAPPASQTPL